MYIYIYIYIEGSHDKMYVTMHYSVSSWHTMSMTPAYKVLADSFQNSGKLRCGNVVDKRKVLP